MLKDWMRNISIAYTGGAFGAAINSLVMYLGFVIGLGSAQGISVMTGWTLEWLYPRLVWGAILGLLFALPYYRTRWVARGLVWSIVPTIPTLFIIFPGQADTVFFGAITGIGVLTLVFTYLLNCIWGLVASFFYEYCQNRV